MAASDHGYRSVLAEPGRRHHPADHVESALAGADRSAALQRYPFAADVDRDDDVDQADFAAFQACFTGSTAGLLTEACYCFDRDEDGDIDSTDAAAFEACASGPGVAANVACDGI